MIKEILNFIRHNRRQIIFYTLIGGSAFLLDISTLILLKEYFHLHPVLAVIINQAFIINYVFFLNKHLSFQAAGQTIKQMQKFIILALGNYLFSVFWMWLWVELLDITFKPGGIFADKDLGYLIGRLSNVLLAVCWNFLLYKHWIYKNH